ncbi:hypothetical protein AGMMS49546_28040 [Spirochaetia bacterium]|nr:hypothetical protein AGMMS49546_28040 [Spirochaetia bacterium]
MGTNSAVGFPPLGFIGGVQISTKAGPVGGLFADFRYGFNFDRLDLTVQNGMHGTYALHTINVSLGYKFGFKDRFKQPEAQNRVWD